MLPLRLQSSLYMASLRGGLVRPSPERSGDDVGWEDAGKGQAGGNAAEFGPTSGRGLACPGPGQARQCFLWGWLVCVVADAGQGGKRQHDQGHVAVPAVPGPAFVMVEAELILAHSKLSSMAQRWPSTATRASTPVPAGRHVLKYARSPSLMLRRMSNPRVQTPGKAGLNSSACRSASSR